ncbi:MULTISPECIES: PfkB family carbohydrate kinase [unclassified Polynucleobacter]|uniref:PfkB family carbohydrate kinase n=1 Tax=unclassified Polynucleobacter TaxID=2640945 RepID=UPI0008AE722E|nr:MULTISPECIES: PfkB family carbohydrate kinase [unclassified Polynucleobacter]OHC09853.1 MAG: ADP-heptose synthase [Polynucleobacter sp. GWA2_45_21]HBK42816.1 ADP-heptose synthase [Polynucleobacter sp.]
MNKTPELISDIDRAVLEIRSKITSDAKISLVTGNFNVIHPGHLRLLNFAADCSDFLVVGIHEDGHDGVFIPINLRLEGMRALSSVVNQVIPINNNITELVQKLKPNFIIKGKEHENKFNEEFEAANTYGGKLLFCSGEMRFSSLDLLRKELRKSSNSNIEKPSDFPERHGFTPSNLSRYVENFQALKVIVIGDLIIDEYISCDTLGLSQEDPTIVVTPLKRDLFIGGAGIVAAHAQSLGAEVELFSITGDDDAAKFANKVLQSMKVSPNLFIDSSRPTTLKQRYRVQNKTLLRVSHLKQHDIATSLSTKIFDKIKIAMRNADLLVFSDFNYGCLPQGLVNSIVNEGQSLGLFMVADSQSSSQMGDISRFQNMQLITPTEHEARLALHGSKIGLTVLAEKLHEKTNARHLVITLGAEGLLIHSPESASKNLKTDLLPAFNSSPKDVSGAGDSFLICSSMALSLGANIWESAYLGSIASACQVSRVGNTPLRNDEILNELTQK